MAFQPISNNILIKLDARPKELKTAGGLFLPDKSTGGLPLQGEVVAVGAGKVTDKGQLIPVTFEPGDRVVFGKYGGTELTIHEEKHIIIPENQLMGVLKDD